MSQQFDKGDDFLNSSQDDNQYLFGNKITPNHKDDLNKFYIPKMGYISFNSNFFFDLSNFL